MAIENDGTGTGDGAAAAGAGAAAVDTGTGQAAGATGAAAAGAAAADTRTGAADTGAAGTRQRTREVPDHRFQQVNTERNTLKTENQRLQDQIRALTNTVPVDDKVAKENAVKEAFFSLFPGAKKLFTNDQMLERLEQFANSGDQVTQAAAHVWNTHSETVLGSVRDEVQQGMGADTLTDRQAAHVNKAFGAYVEDDVKRVAQELADDGIEPTEQAIRKRSTVLQQYERKDPKLIKAFAKEFLEDFYEPARRQVTSGEVRRNTAAVPLGRQRGPVVMNNGAKHDPKNLDAVLDAAISTAKERGVTFGRR